VGFRFDKTDFETPLVALRPEPLVMLEVPPQYLMLKLEKYFMDKVELIGSVISIVEIALVVQPSDRRIAAVDSRMGLSSLRRPSRQRDKRGDKFQTSRSIPAEVAENSRVGRRKVTPTRYERRRSA
jgi:hypothetical protein